MQTWHRRSHMTDGTNPVEKQEQFHSHCCNLMLCNQNNIQLFGTLKKQLQLEMKPPKPLECGHINRRNILSYISFTKTVEKITIQDILPPHPLPLFWTLTTFLVQNSTSGSVSRWWSAGVGRCLIFTKSLLFTISSWSVAKEMLSIPQLISCKN